MTKLPGNYFKEQKHTRTHEHFENYYLHQKQYHKTSCVTICMEYDIGEIAASALLVVVDTRVPVYDSGA